MANEGIHVTGVYELSAALKALDPEAAKQLKKAMRAIAAEVVKNARGRMEFGPGTAASSVKPSGTMRGAAISFPRGGPGSGDDSDGYYPWLDFGGGVPFGRGVTGSDPVGHQKTDWRKVGYAGFRREHVIGGRYVYPAIDDARRSGFIEDAAYEAIERAARSEGFEVRG